MHQICIYVCSRQLYMHAEIFVLFCHKMQNLKIPVHLVKTSSNFYKMM